jgi:hypothetical protein
MNAVGSCKKVGLKNPMLLSYGENNNWPLQEIPVFRNRFLYSILQRINWVLYKMDCQ